MKNTITIIIFLLLSCKYDNRNNKIKNIPQKSTISFTENKEVNESDGLKELSLPYCLKIDTLPKSDYYQTDLDTFLFHHNFVKNTLSDINAIFHRNTEDFISDKQANFMHSPYNGKAFAISILRINDKITAIFYAYLIDSEIIQPRIEIQTFDNNQKNIDNLIIASTFTSECSGYREFCITKDKIITINNYYYCSDDGDAEYKNQFKYKISDTGKFVFLK